MVEGAGGDQAHLEHVATRGQQALDQGLRQGRSREATVAPHGDALATAGADLRSQGLADEIDQLRAEGLADHAADVVGLEDLLGKGRGTFHGQSVLACG